MTRHSNLKRKSVTTLPIWTSGYLGNKSLEASLEKVCSKLTGCMLDLGCGNSPYRAWLTNVTTYVPYDVDSSNDTAKVIGSAMVLPFANSVFSSLLCTQVLEHVEQPWLAIEEVARVLEPGGLAVISVPQAWRIHEAPYDFYRYTRYGLSALLQRSGLEMTSCEPQGGAWLVIGQTIINHLWASIGSRNYARFSLLWIFSRSFVVPLTILLNLISPVLDRLFFDTDETLNYVAVAIKR